MFVVAVLFGYPPRLKRSPPSPRHEVFPAGLRRIRSTGQLSFSQYGGFLGGTPKMENPKIEWMIWGYPHGLETSCISPTRKVTDMRTKISDDI